MSGAALAISIVAIGLSALSLLLSYKGNRRDADRRRDERRPVMEVKVASGQILFRCVGGAELEDVTAYLPHHFFALREGDAHHDWTTTNGDQARLGHPIEHRRWWPLPDLAEDASGDVSFVLYISEGKHEWQIPLTATLPGQFFAY